MVFNPAIVRKMIAKPAEVAKIEWLATSIAFTTQALRVVLENYWAHTRQNGSRFIITIDHCSERL